MGAASEDQHASCSFVLSPASADGLDTALPELNATALQWKDLREGGTHCLKCAAIAEGNAILGIAHLIYVGVVHRRLVEGLRLWKGPLVRIKKLSGIDGKRRLASTSRYDPAVKISQDTLSCRVEIRDRSSISSQNDLIIGIEH
jgi:hypothetical protein